MAYIVPAGHALMVPGAETQELGGGSAEMARAATVARRFYLDRLTKKEIGSQLGISRFKVARLLDLAVASDLVNIEVRSPIGFDLRFANELRGRFDLTEAWVVDQDAKSVADERELLGIAAAPIVSDLIEPGEVIGIGWGRTLSAMVDHLPALPDSTVVQLGGGTSMPYGDSAADLPRRLAERFGVETFLLHAPLFVGDPAVADALRADGATAETLKMLGRLTTALIGVGTWTPEHPIAATTLTADDIEALESAAIVAHSLPLFFTSDGRTGLAHLQERAIGVTSEELRATPRRILVAGGRDKADALRAALSSRIVTHLVTDTDAARAVLSEAHANGAR